MAYLKLKSSIDKNKSRINKLRKKFEFKLGDLVYVELTNKLNRSKYDEIRKDPFETIKIVSPHLYQLNTNKKRLENNIFHKLN